MRRKTFSPGGNNENFTLLFARAQPEGCDSPAAATAGSGRKSAAPRPGGDRSAAVGAASSIRAIAFDIAPIADGPANRRKPTSAGRAGAAGRGDRFVSRGLVVSLCSFATLVS